MALNAASEHPRHFGQIRDHDPDGYRAAADRQREGQSHKARQQIQWDRRSRVEADPIHQDGSVPGHDMSVLGQLYRRGNIIPNEPVELLDAHRSRLNTQFRQAFLNGRHI